MWFLLNIWCDNDEKKLVELSILSWQNGILVKNYYPCILKRISNRRW